MELQSDLLKGDSNFNSFFPFLTLAPTAAVGGEVMINPNLHVSSDVTVSCSNAEVKVMNDAPTLIRRVTSYSQDSFQRCGSSSDIVLNSHAVEPFALYILLL